MTIANTDKFLVNRNGGSFRLDASDISSAQPTDLFLVNRNGASFKCTAADLGSKLQDNDLMLINRSDQSYKVTGAEVKSILIDPNEVVQPAAPYATVDSVQGNWIDVAAGNGIIVAIQNPVRAGIAPAIYGSKGTYQDSNLPDNNYVCLCFGKGKFIAISANPFSYTFFAKVSTDGINWTDSNQATGDGVSDTSAGMQYKGVCYHAATDEFIALVGATNGDILAVKSSDGIDWVSTNVGTASGTGVSPNYGIVSGQDGILQAGTNTNRKWSPDGLTWTGVTPTLTGNTQAIGYGTPGGNGTWYALGNGTQNWVAGDGGTNWVAGAAVLPSNSIDVVYGQGCFLFVSGDGPGTFYGYGWSDKPSLSSAAEGGTVFKKLWKRVCFSQELRAFHAVGTDCIMWINVDPNR